MKCLRCKRQTTGITSQGVESHVPLCRCCLSHIYKVTNELQQLMKLVTRAYKAGLRADKRRKTAKKKTPKKATPSGRRGRGATKKVSGRPVKSRR